MSMTPNHRVIDIDRIILRRLHVLRMRMRQMTAVEIALNLEREGFLNPETGKGYAAGTIQKDIAAIRAEWRENTAEMSEDHFNELLAEIREARRVAWKSEDLDKIYKGLMLEIKLTGVSREKQAPEIAVSQTYIEVQEMSSGEMLAAMHAFQASMKAQAELADVIPATAEEVQDEEQD